MNDQTKRTDDPKAHIRLTDDQRKELAEIFGQDLVSRLETIEIEQVAGFLKANAALN